jgi:hypothetical protein
VILLVEVGLISLLLLSGALVWPVGFLVRRLRHRFPETTGAQQGARWLAWNACLVALGFLGGLIAVIGQAASDNPFLLAFGVPGSAGWLFLLPWVVLMLTCGVVVLAGLAWKQKWWKKPARTYYSLIATACLGFVIFLSYWGLM